MLSQIPSEAAAAPGPGACEPKVVEPQAGWPLQLASGGTDGTSRRPDSAEYFQTNHHYFKKKIVNSES